MTVTLASPPPAGSEFDPNEPLRSNPTLLSIVIPVYNEAQVLPALFDSLRTLLDFLPCHAEVILVDDGSTDHSWALILKMRPLLPQLVALSLRRNFGHQAAVSAGLATSTGDAVVVMDADLQDPPSLILSMMKEWRKGADVVSAVRTTREGNWALRLAYRTFYKLLTGITKTPIVPDSGDFCLMDRAVVDVINSLKERNRFIRGLRAWVGGKTATVCYDRPARQAGKSKYSIWKLMKLAFDGFFGFSHRPLVICCTLNLAVSTIAFIAGAGYLLDRLIRGFVEPRGFTTLVVLMCSFGFMQSFTFWIISSYFIRLMDESRERPLYLIRETFRD